MLPVSAVLTPEAVKRCDTLGGGGTSSVHLDTQAKTYAQLLRGTDVPVPEGWTNEPGTMSENRQS